ncbi:MAG: LolA-related protein [Comamonas sp.]
MKSLISKAIPAALLAISLSCAVAAPAQTAAFDANALMLLLSSHPPGKATFVETKTLAMLKKPIVSEGELRYDPPGKLTMITRTPKAESMVIDGDTLVRQADGKTGRIKLDDYPEVAGMIEGIRGSLGGNRMLLEQHYHLEVSGSSSEWRMRLTPKDSRVSRFIKQLDVSGLGSTIRAIDILQADGDSSHMAITPQP